MSAAPVTASVIVLNFNGAQYLPACLGSLLDQDMPEGEYEVILADNGSSDDSVALVRDRFPRVRLLELGRNYGFCGGNNRAAATASGRYLVFLNMDTIVHRRWLSALVTATESHPAIKACQSNMIMPWVEEFAHQDRVGFPGKVWRFELCRWGFARYQASDLDDSLLSSLFLTGASCLVDRTLLDPDGQVFDPRFGAYGEDLDLALRILNRGYRIVTVPHSVVFHLSSFAMHAGAGPRSLSLATRIVRNRILAFCKNLRLPEILALLPIIVIGSPLKVMETGWHPGRKLVYALGAIPITLLACAWALLSYPAFARSRRSLLRHGHRPCGWLLRALWGGGKEAL